MQIANITTVLGTVADYRGSDGVELESRGLQYLLWESVDGKIVCV